jgi:hypothetical protein
MVVRLAAAGEPSDRVVTVVGDQVLVATPADVGKVVTVAADGTLVFDDAAGGGVTDHGALTGLADDDHNQYATDAALTTHAGTTHGVTDHGDLTGLADDDHPYILETLIDAADDLIVGTAADTAGRLAVAASRIVGKKATGGLAALTAAEVLAILGSPTIHEYEAGADAALKASTSTTIEDVDATNAAITFTPTGTSALIEVSAIIGNSTAGKYSYLALRDGSGTIAGTDMRVVFGAIFVRPYYAKKITGLTPGAPTTIKLGIATDSAATASLYTGPAYGPLVMKATLL